MPSVFKSAVDKTFYFVLSDSTSGNPKTGLLITDIDLSYVRNRSTPNKVDATALAAVDSAHADNKAFEVDATNFPGVYRGDFPDAAFATGADKVILGMSAPGCDPSYLLVSLVDINNQDGIRAGLTALPNAAADAAGGLPISDAGGLAMDTVGSNVTSIKAKTDPLTFTVANQVDANALTGGTTPAGIRSAIGMGSANLDTQLGTIGTIAVDIETRIPDSLAGGRMPSDIGSIFGSSTGIPGLSRAVAGIVTGTVGNGSTTTSIVTSSLSPSVVVASQFNGLVLKFDAGTTTPALRGQATDITAMTSGGVLTVTALTTAPANGDTFTIE